MIGQKTLRNRLSQLIAYNSFPRFMVLVGDNGSGRKTLIKWLETEWRSVTFIRIDKSVDAVRDMVEQSYKSVGKCYVIEDADSMSINARNALLKVTEEPPNGTYYIVTVQSLVNLLPTLVSRASVYHMDRYSEEELRYYISSQGYTVDALEWCETVGEIKDYCSSGGDTMCDYICRMVEHLHCVSDANALKIASVVQFKDGEDGYDMIHFLKVFIKVCEKNMLLNLSETVWMDVIKATVRCMQESYNRSINRRMLFDMWLLSVKHKLENAYDG